MVTFLLALLCISIVGLVTLLSVKRRELSTGRVMFGGLRPKAGKLLGQGMHFLERQAPAIATESARRAIARGRVASHRVVAWAVLKTERGLESTLQVLRGATQERGAGEASAFLREVAEHKKSLLKRSGKKPNAIYEE